MVALTASPAGAIQDGPFTYVSNGNWCAQNTASIIPNGGGYAGGGLNGSKSGGCAYPQNLPAGFLRVSVAVQRNGAWCTAAYSSSNSTGGALATFAIVRGYLDCGFGSYRTVSWAAVDTFGGTASDVRVSPSLSFS